MTDVRVYIKRNCFVSRKKREGVLVMVKSDVKGPMIAACPEAFSNVPPAGVDVLIKDAIFQIRALAYQITRGGEETMTHVRVLMYHTFNDMLYNTQKYVVQVAAFDKSMHVTDAKRPEQTRRDAKPAAMDKEELKECFEKLKLALRRDKLESFDLRAKEWAALVEHRESRQFVITAVCRYASVAIPGILAEAGVPEDHSIVLDYQEMDLDETTAKKGESVVLWLRAGSKEAGESNSFGEFDVAAWWWQKKMREIPGVHTVMVQSKDTDLMMIGTLVHKPGDSVYVETTMQRKAYFFDISAFHTWLTTRSYVVEDFVKMYILGGSDFVLPCPGMTSKVAMRQFLKVPNTDPKAVISAAVKNGKRKTPGSAGRDKIDAYDAELSFKRTKWTIKYWKGEYSPVLGHGWGCDNGAAAAIESESSRKRRFEE